MQDIQELFGTHVPEHSTIMFDTLNLGTMLSGLRKQDVHDITLLGLA